MTSDKPPLLHENEAASTATETTGSDGRARHEQAMQHPETLVEQALVEMLRGWKRYLHELQGEVTGLLVDTDTAHALHTSWSQMGAGLLGLLQGHCDRLDKESLAQHIRALLSEPLTETFYPSDDPLQDWEPSVDMDLFDNAPLVFAYSRAQALEDGVLMDVTDPAREAGFRLPVALTAALWADIHAIPQRLQGIADPTGRLWDVLFVGRCTMSRQPHAQSSCCYHVEMPVGEATRYEVKLCCGPGDAGEPVVTLMQKGED